MVNGGAAVIPMEDAMAGAGGMLAKSRGPYRPRQLEMPILGESEQPLHIPDAKAEARNLNFFYGTNQVLKNVNLEFARDKVTALIGPSGCGKTTLLRCFNRMHDLYKGNRYEGELLLF